MNDQDIRRALARVAHEILERNRGAEDLIVVGIHTRGVHLAQRLASNLTEFEGSEVPVADLDINLYRDDVKARMSPRIRPTRIPVDIQGKKVVLVDDVLFTGRTVRAAMDALNDFGRPQQIQLAILLDRGHREMPIKADFVGKNIHTSDAEHELVRLEEVDGEDAVYLVKYD